MGPKSATVASACAGNGIPATVDLDLDVLVHLRGGRGRPLTAVVARPCTLVTAPQAATGMLVAVPSTATRHA